MFIYKIGSALFVAIVTAAMGWFGYVESTGSLMVEQTTNAIFGIRFLIGCVPALCLIISVIFINKLSLGKESFDNVKKSISSNL